MNNLFSKGKMVSIFQFATFTIFENVGLFNTEISNTLRSETETVYNLLLTIANRAVEPPSPIGEAEIFF